MVKLLHWRVSALSNEELIFSVVSLLLAMGLFYVVGGRSLARRHSMVVKRATRDSLTDWATIARSRTSSRGRRGRERRKSAGLVRMTERASRRRPAG